MAIDNQNVSAFSLSRAQDLRQQRVIDALNSFNIPEGLKSILYGNIRYESDTSFDINKVEKKNPGDNSAKGVGLFQKTGPTKRNYEDYLTRNKLENNERNEIKYYLDGISGKDAIVSEYLGNGYMLDYRNMLSGKVSAERGGRHGIARKDYEPVFRDMHEHFVNFMMNPLPEARVKSLPTRLQFSLEARKNIFNKSKLPESTYQPRK
tara:strand:- start:2547 stop:3167 length:621 start_codon:yes stop_codon:yes gene_type:complete